MKTCKQCGSTETLPNRWLCRQCQAKYMRDYYSKNRDKFSAYWRAYHYRKMANPKNRDSARERGRAFWRNLRDEVVAAYGGKCACCGETEPRFLSIDHVNNDGAAHRRSLGATKRNGEGGGSATLAWIKKNGFPSGFQVLCMNCNMGKFRNGGTCPHQTNRNMIVANREASLLDR